MRLQGKRKMKRTIQKIILLDRAKEMSNQPRGYPVSLMKAVQIKELGTVHMRQSLTNPRFYSLMKAVQIKESPLARQQSVAAALDKGENIDGLNQYGQTSLMVAVIQNNSGVASQLIGLRADPSIQVGQRLTRCD